MIFLELSAVAILLALLARSRPFRRWISSVKRGDLRVAIGIVALLFIGQFLWIGRYTFPLVHWSMYTTVDAPDEFQIVECRAINAKGESVRFSPVRMFPSLTRNFNERFLMMVSSRQRGTLTPDGERVYGEMMNSLLNRYQQNNRSNPAVAMEAVLVTRRSTDGSRVKEIVISRTDWKANQGKFARVTSEVTNEVNRQETQR